MKKLFILLAALAIGTSSMAQKMKIISANGYLKDQQYDKAAEAINEAVASESTKDNPDAWFKRGQVYLTMATEPQYEANKSKYMDIAAESFDKVYSLKSDYNPEYLNAYFSNLMSNYYNMGVGDYSAKNYESAYTQFLKVPDIYKKYGGPSRWSIKSEEGKNTAKLVRLSKTFAAEASIASNKFPEALALYEQLTATNAVPDSELERVYTNMLIGYQKGENTDKFNALVAKAAKKYPDNTTFKTQQLNLIMASGDGDKAISELEKASAEKPNDANLLMALGEVYRSSAEKIMKAGANDGEKLATMKDYMAKAESNFEKAYAIKKDPRVGYQLGYLNMVQANSIIERMNKLTTSANDMRKYDIMDVEMKKSFGAAVPYFEATVAALEAGNKYKENKESLDLYYTTLRAINQAYSRTNEKAKADATYEKIKAIEAK